MDGPYNCLTLCSGSLNASPANNVADIVRKQDDRGVLCGNEEGDRRVPGTGGLLHPVRVPESGGHGALGPEDSGPGGTQAAL